MIICEVCGTGDAPNYGVRFDFSCGLYLCPQHHRGSVVVANIGIKRKLIGKQVTQATERHIMDRQLSPDDGETLISKSTGRPWEWLGE